MPGWWTSSFAVTAMPAATSGRAARTSRPASACCRTARCCARRMSRWRPPTAAPRSRWRVARASRFLAPATNWSTWTSSRMCSPVGASSTPTATRSLPPSRTPAASRSTSASHAMIPRRSRRTSPARRHSTCSSPAVASAWARSITRATSCTGSAPRSTSGVCACGPAAPSDSGCCSSAHGSACPAIPCPRWSRSKFSFDRRCGRWVPCRMRSARPSP